MFIFSSLPFQDFMTMDTKFSFDNVNRKLVGAGVYAIKNSGRAQGYFSFSIPPQYKEGDKINVYSQIFDDAFVSALLGKKTTEQRGRPVGLDL